MRSFFLAVVASAILLSACQTRNRQAENPNQQTTVQQADAKSGSALLVEAKEKLIEAKKKLVQEGKYNCCIKDPCDFCGLHEAACDCYADLKKGEHICIECYAGWQQGNGADERMKKESVKTDFVKHDHKH